MNDKAELTLKVEKGGRLLFHLILLIPMAFFRVIILFTGIPQSWKAEQCGRTEDDWDWLTHFENQRPHAKRALSANSSTTSTSAIGTMFTTGGDLFPISSV